MTLTTAQLDRAVGALLGTAAGDARALPDQFGPPRGPQLEVAMVGGGSFAWEPGEWTDDTSMAIAIAEVAASGADLRDEKALDAIVNRWHEWMKTGQRRWHPNQFRLKEPQAGSGLSWVRLRPGGIRSAARAHLAAPRATAR